MERPASALSLYGLKPLRIPRALCLPFPAILALGAIPLLLLQAKTYLFWRPVLWVVRGFWLLVLRVGTLQAPRGQKRLLSCTLFGPVRLRKALGKQ